MSKLLSIFGCLSHVSQSFVPHLNDFLFYLLFIDPGVRFRQHRLIKNAIHVGQTLLLLDLVSLL